MFFSVCLSENFARQCPATERESEHLLLWRTLTPPPPSCDPTWDLYIHYDACAEAVCVCWTYGAQHPGKKPGLAEEEIMYLFQYNTTILIKSEVSDPENMKLAKNDILIILLWELRPGQRLGTIHTWPESEKDMFRALFSAVKGASEIKAGSWKVSC